VYYTREQLAAAVSDSKISEAEANAIWDRQQESRIRDGVMGEIKTVLTTAQREAEIQRRIDQFIGFDPELATPGTEAYNAVQNEKRSQQAAFGTKLSAKELEYQALRTLYGDETRLSNRSINERDRPSHRETYHGGGHRDSGGGGDTELDKFKKSLHSDEFTYYDDLIKKGQYSGWEEVQKEQKYANSGLRKRTAARLAGTT